MSSAELVPITCHLHELRWLLARKPRQICAHVRGLKTGFLEALPHVRPIEPVATLPRLDEPREGEELIDARLLEEAGYSVGEVREVAYDPPPASLWTRSSPR